MQVHRAHESSLQVYKICTKAITTQQEELWATLLARQDDLNTRE